MSNIRTADSIPSNRRKRLEYLEVISNRMVLSCRDDVDIVAKSIIEKCNTDSTVRHDHRVGVLSNQINNALEEQKINHQSFRYTYLLKDQPAFGKTWLIGNLGIFKDESACINVLCYDNAIYVGAALNYKMPTLENCVLAKKNAVYLVETQLRKIGFDILLSKTIPTDRLKRWVQRTDQYKNVKFVDLIDGADMEIANQVADRLSKQYKKIRIKRSADLYTIAGEGKKISRKGKQS